MTITKDEEEKVVNSNMRTCGHRITEKQFIKLRKLSRKWKCGEAEALRIIINEA
jgi:hypothetical protein